MVKMEHLLFYYSSSLKRFEIGEFKLALGRGTGSDRKVGFLRLIACNCNVDMDVSFQLCTN